MGEYAHWQKKSYFKIFSTIVPRINNHFNRFPRDIHNKHQCTPNFIFLSLPRHRHPIVNPHPNNIIRYILLILYLVLEQQEINHPIINRLLQTLLRQLHTPSHHVNCDHNHNNRNKINT